MATISNTPRPGYAWDATDNCWYPIGTGPHTHSDYISQSTAINPTIVDAKGDIITATAADTPARLAVGTDGQALIADSTASTGLKWGSATPALNEQIFTSSGSWTAPTGVTKIWVDVLGGGGGGGRGQSYGAAAGGSGARVQKQLTVTPGTSYTITIGAGGAAASSYDGSAGSASSFDSTSAEGGAWGPGGQGYTGATNESNGPSQAGISPRSSNAPANSGAGGSSGNSTARAGGSGLVTVRWIG